MVSFRQGKSTIDASQYANVERVASYLKNHKNAKVKVEGYASPEGSKAINEALAKKRAEAVKNMLVKKYKIAANRIDATGKGVGNMFSEPDWNRVAISTIAK
jgi:OOP family OmpA-OmpF porin